MKNQKRDLPVSDTTNLENITPSITPVYEIARFAIIFETQLENKSRDISKLVFLLMSSIKSIGNSLRKSSSVSHLRPWTQTYKDELPIMKMHEYEWLLEEMVSTNMSDQEMNNAMNKLGHITNISLQQGKHVVMPDGVRNAAKKLPMTKTVLLDTVISYSSD